MGRAFDEDHDYKAHELEEATATPERKRQLMEIWMFGRKEAARNREIRQAFDQLCTGQTEKDRLEAAEELQALFKGKRDFSDQVYAWQSRDAPCESAAKNCVDVALAYPIEAFRYKRSKLFLAAKHLLDLDRPKSAFSLLQNQSGSGLIDLHAECGDGRRAFELMAPYVLDTINTFNHFYSGDSAYRRLREQQHIELWYTMGKDGREVESKRFGDAREMFLDTKEERSTRKEHRRAAAQLQKEKKDLCKQFVEETEPYFELACERYRSEQKRNASLAGKADEYERELAKACWEFDDNGYNPKEEDDSAVAERLGFSLFRGGRHELMEGWTEERPKKRARKDDWFSF